MLRYGRLGATLSLDITGDMARMMARLPEGHKVIRVSTVSDYKKETSDGFLAGRFRGFVRGTHVIVGLPAPDKQTESSVEECVALWTALVTHPVKRTQFVAAFCDEAEQVFPASGRISDSFRLSILVARNEKRSVILAVKRPTALATAARSAARRLCVFRVASDADVKACAELGPAALFSRVQYLKRGRYLYYSANEHTPEDTLPELDSMDPPPWV